MKGAGPAVFAAAIVFLSGCSRPEARGARFLQYGDGYFEKKDYARAALEYRNAIQALPGRAEPHYRLALTHIETGDAQAAADSLERALDLEPSHKRARLKLAELMALSRDGAILREANRRLKEIVTAFPDDAEGVNLLAITEWRLGKTADAEKRLSEALARTPAHLKAAVTLASIKVSENKPGEAEEILRKAAVRGGLSPAPVAALGRLYLLQGKFAEAEEQFELARSRAPRDGEVLLDLARARLARGRKDAAEAAFRELSAMDRKYRLVHAVFLFQNGSPEKAIEELKAAVKADRRDRDARTALVSAHLSLGRVAEAEAILAEALGKNPKDIEARLQRAQVLIAARRYAEAENDLAIPLKYEPEMGEAHYLLAKIRAARGARLHQRQQLDRAIKGNPRLLAARIELARELIAAGASGAALDLMNGAPPDQAASMPAVIQRNWALVAAGEYDEARKGVAAAMEKARLPELLLQTAVIELAAGRHQAARTAIEEALEKSPEDPRLLQTLAGIYVAEKNLPGAIERLRRHAERHPGSAVAQKTLADWLLRAGFRGPARTAFAAAKSAAPDDVSVDLALADLDLAEGKTDSARRRLAALANSAKPHAAALFELGNLEESEDNRGAAIAYYRKALEADPSHPGALNNLAYLLADFAGASDEALKYAQMAVEADPDNPIMQDTLGWVYYQKGLYEIAVKHLERAANSGAATPLYHLGVVYAKLGDRARSEKALRAGLRLSPGSREAGLAMQLLKAAQSGR